MGTGLYRLRMDGRTVGYRKQVGRYAFYSRDDFWYNGTELPFEIEDAFAGVKDRQGRKLFAGDVVRIRTDGDEKVVRIQGLSDDVPAVCCHITQAPIPLNDPLAVLARGLFVTIANEAS